MIIFKQNNHFYRDIRSKMQQKLSKKSRYTQWTHKMHHSLSNKSPNLLVANTHGLP